MYFHKVSIFTPWKESYDQPRQHIQNRDITLPTKVRLVKAMVFPVVMYGCVPEPYAGLDPGPRLSGEKAGLGPAGV